MSVFAPTADQDEVIHASEDSRSLVVAPAGTGKTEVLRRRVGWLVEECGLSPGAEVLVVTFTRAAVKELRSRLRESGDDSAFVRAVTFDSLATRLLSDWLPTVLESAADYDTRIRAATGLLLQEENSPLAEIRHVLIDEIQDLVGDRAEFVLALLKRSACGFTLFGDPAQAIYDFQLAESESKLTSAGFVGALDNEYGRELRRYEFHENWRARSEVARKPLVLGADLRAEKVNVPAVERKLQRVVGNLPRCPIASALPGLREPPGQTALLTRFRSQALSISRYLWSEGVDHRLQSRATDRPVAPWVGEILSRVQQAELAKTRFEELFEASTSNGDISADVAWRLLRRLNGSAGRSVNVLDVRDNLALGFTPDELTYVPPATVTVSNIHRIKGLQFDIVYCIEPDFQTIANVPTEEALDEIRLAFVALSRARDRVLICGDSPDVRGMTCRTNPGGRWVRQPKPFITTDVEVLAQDADAAAPASSASFDACETQLYLASRVRPGDPISFVLGDGPVPALYSIEHNGRTIGRSSESFRKHMTTILARARPGRRVVFPMRMDSLRVESVDSVAGLPTEGEEAGLGPSGIWLRVRPSGLGHLVWSD